MKTRMVSHSNYSWDDIIMLGAKQFTLLKPEHYGSLVSRVGAKLTVESERVIMFRKIGDAAYIVAN